MAGQRFRKKRSAARRARKGLKRSAPGLAKAVKAIARKEAFKAQETKYVSGVDVARSAPGDFVNANPQSQLISKVVIGDLSTLQPAIPALVSGTASNLGIGSQVQHARGRVDFYIALQDEASDALSFSQNIIVKIFCLESRSSRNMYNLINYMPKNDLLRVGIDRTVDWIPGGVYYPTQLEMMPVNQLAWKVHHVKTFHLQKNPGRQTGGAASTGAISPNRGRNVAQFSWNWKHDGALKYNEVGASGSMISGSTDFPTNFAPVYGIVCYYADGQQMNPEELDNVLNVNVRTHMWYKDG